MSGETSEGMLFDIGYVDGIVPVLAQRKKLYLMVQGLDKAYSKKF
jgi:hypothetical protein